MSGLVGNSQQPLQAPLVDVDIKLTLHFVRKNENRQKIIFWHAECSYNRAVQITDGSTPADNTAAHTAWPTTE